MQSTNKQSISSQDSKKLYDEGYYLNYVDGASSYNDFDGSYSKLTKRYKRNLDILNLKSNEYLIDIGCGRGEIVMHHALNKGRAIGIDYSDSAINIARKKARELNINCEFFTSSFEFLETTNENFDVIYCSEFYEHITHLEAKKFLNLAYSKLTDNGRLFIHTYPNTLNRRYGYKLSVIFGKFLGKRLPKVQPETLTPHFYRYHLNEQNIFSLRRDVKNAGFKILSSGYDEEFDGGLLIKNIFRNKIFKHLFHHDLYLIAKK